MNKRKIYPNNKLDNTVLKIVFLNILVYMTIIENKYIIFVHTIIRNIWYN